VCPFVFIEEKQAALLAFVLCKLAILCFRFSLSYIRQLLRYHLMQTLFTLIFPVSYSYSLLFVAIPFTHIFTSNRTLPYTFCPLFAFILASSASMGSSPHVLQLLCINSDMYYILMGLTQSYTYYHYWCACNSECTLCLTRSISLN
jgi:hypothetical protein